MDSSSSKKPYSMYCRQPSAKDLEYFKRFQTEVYDVEQAKRCTQKFKKLLAKCSHPTSWSELIEAVLRGEITSPVYVIQNSYILEDLESQNIPGLTQAWIEFTNALAGYDFVKWRAHIDQMFKR